MHVSCIGSADALPRIFDHLDKIGARVVPVSELLLSYPPKPKVGAPVKPRITAQARPD